MKRVKPEQEGVNARLCLRHLMATQDVPGKGNKGAEGQATPSWSQLPAQGHGAHAAQEPRVGSRQRLRGLLTGARQAAPEGSQGSVTAGRRNLSPGRDTAVPMLNRMSATF